MTVLAGWAEAEAVGMALMDPGVGKAVQTTPAVIVGRLIQVLRIGGADDGITDYPLLHFLFYSDTYEDACAAAEEGRQIVLAAPGTAVVVEGYPKPILIDSARTRAAPIEAPRDNPDLRLKTGTFQISYRRPRA